VQKIQWDEHPLESVIQEIFLNKLPLHVPPVGVIDRKYPKSQTSQDVSLL